jgi:hypothetical protein
MRFINSVYHLILDLTELKNNYRKLYLEQLEINKNLQIELNKLSCHQ